MSNFEDVMSRILGVVFIIIVFSIAYAYLKPHRMHKRRPASTLLLKGSYLLYLLILLLIVFMASFYKGGLDKVFLEIESFAFLVVLFGPTIGIFARKLGHFREKRENFNYFFIVINILSITALILMYTY
jgi:hypothetical protein